MRSTAVVVLALAVVLSSAGAQAALSLGLRSGFTKSFLGQLNAMSPAGAAGAAASKTHGTGFEVNNLGSSCDASTCNFLCPVTSHDPACCTLDTCYYDTFWVTWNCCNSDNGCCGKLTGGAIAIIVLLVVLGTGGICACIYCCCCRAPRQPVVVAGTTAYVVMPNGQAQAVVPGQPIVYYQGAGGAQTTGGAAMYQPPPQQFQNTAAPAYTS